LQKEPKPTQNDVPLVDFSRQYSQIRTEVLAAITEVCDSQQFILGPAVSAFETEAAAFCGATHGIGCASGTDALWLAMAAAGVAPGDVVVTTPFSFFATVSAILRAGARPLLVDIDPRTFNLDPARIGAAAKPSAAVRAILPVHLYGQCADWDALKKVQQERGCLLIEDAAQAFGAQWQGRPAGSLGDAAAFSFYPTKNLSAFGDAGLVTTRNDDIADHARLLRGHGMRQRYFHEEIGWNSRLDSIQAAVLRIKLKYVAQWNRQRRERAAIYDDLLQRAGLAESGPYPQNAVVLPYKDPRGTHVFHQYVIRVQRRDELRAFLSERGIGSEIYYPVPLHLQSSLHGLGYNPGDFPESERAAREVLALPIFPELTVPEQEQVIAAIVKFLS
jgi:dTDP-4-amino-4,6-dideoxygalactose transaminase